MKRSQRLKRQPKVYKVGFRRWKLAKTGPSGLTQQCKL